MSSEWKQLFERARFIAIAAHQEQRYGVHPYEHHLYAVVEVLQRFGAHLNDKQTAPLLVAAWLHDTIEDTGLERDFLAQEFGVAVAELVWRVTDEPGATRKERKPATYHKMRENESAIILKLADRIANVEACLQNNPAKLTTYANEQPEFAAVLRPASPSQMAQQMWEHLERCINNSAARSD
jgi:(p)ppGpp synthase/HD superfamily hydrolase